MASPVTTYNTLVAAVLEASFDDSAELQSFIPIAVNNAELRMTKELDNLGLTIVGTVTAYPSTPSVTKPTGLRVIHSLVYIDPATSRRSVLRKKTDDYLAAYWPQDTSVGTPVYYSDITNTTCRIVPCVSVSSSLEFTYEARPTSLSTSNQTNYFTDFCADALFYATMLEIAIWQRNKELYDYYENLYSAARGAINNEGTRQRRDDGSPVENPEAGQNTLQADKQPY